MWVGGCRRPTAWILIRYPVYKSAFKPLEDGLTNAFSSLLSGGFSGTGFANGGAFAGGIPTPFASGGVIQSPIAFPLGGGQSGIAGDCHRVQEETGDDAGRSTAYLREPSR